MAQMSARSWRDHGPFSRRLFGLAAPAEFGEHRKIHSAAPTVPELAFRPWRYAAADYDLHWNTQRSALTLAALRSVALCCRASSSGPKGESFFHPQESRS